MDLVKHYNVSNMFLHLVYWAQEVAHSTTIGVEYASKLGSGLE